VNFSENPETRSQLQDDSNDGISTSLSTSCRNPWSSLNVPGRGRVRTRRSNVRYAIRCTPPINPPRATACKGPSLTSFAAVPVGDSRAALQRVESRAEAIAKPGLGDGGAAGSLRGVESALG
jgi:hypothetical protein